MKKAIELICVLSTLAVVTYGESFTYTGFDMNIKPMREKECDKKCVDTMALGMKMANSIFEGPLRNVKFALDFCEECYVRNLHEFTFTNKCFMNSDKTIFDHQFHICFPHGRGDCKCTLSNRPSATAAKVNAAKSPEGDCGSKQHKNQLMCKNIECPGDQEDTKTKVEMYANSNETKLCIDMDFRIDTNPHPTKKEGHAYPTKITLTSEAAEVIKHAGDAGKFSDSWKCLNSNRDAFYCHFINNVAAAFFDCVNNNGKHSLITSVLYEYGKCNSKA